MKLYRSSQGIELEVDGKFYGADDTFLARLFGSGKGEVQRLIDEVKLGDEIKGERRALPPVLDETEVWAAGVTYLRSKSARMEESEEAGGDVFYDMVYEADRPELFFKSIGRRAVGNGGEIRVREDSTWDVPEPELTLAVNAGGEIFGFTVGNDVSSRSIEGENPLYLPQAKVYDGSCAVGPCLLLGREALKKEAFIKLKIMRGRELVFDDRTDVGQLKRSLDELVDYLCREVHFSHGALLMTGTGLVPGSDFTLKSGDVVEIEIEGVGVLTNLVA